MNNEVSISNEKGNSDPRHSTNKSESHETIIIVPTINVEDNNHQLQNIFVPYDKEKPSLTDTQPKPDVEIPDYSEHRRNSHESKLVFEEEEIAPKKTLSKTQELLNSIHDRFPGRIIRRVLKCTIAYFVSTLFSLVEPLSNALGSQASLTTTGMLNSHPARSMGAQFDATITGVLGILVAVLYAYVGMACAVAYNLNYPETLVTGPKGRAINAVFLFVGIFWSQILRQVYPKFHFFSLQFMTIQIFCMTKAMDFVAMDYNLPLSNAIPLMLGHGLSLFVNLFFWPETAVEGLGRALEETILSSRDMLNLITRQFFLDPDAEPVPESIIDQTADKMRKGMTKVKAAYREAKYETSYAYIRPQQLSQLRKSLGRLTKHLSILGNCLKSERELFASAIEALKAEGSDSDLTDTENESRRKSTSGIPTEDSRSYSNVDLNLLKTALRATNDFIKSPSRHASRQPSRQNSDDEDYEEVNQRSVSSIKSFLPKLSIPKPKLPEKSKRQTEYHHRHLLLTYLDSLRDPLLDLSLKCTTALECVRDTIDHELDVDQDDDATIRETWAAYFANALKLKKRQSQRVIELEKQEAAFIERHNGTTCNCSQMMRLAIIDFDKAERERMHHLYQLNRSRTGSDVLDLGMRQELFLVFFFIFTLREVASELQDMTIYTDELRMYVKANMDKHGNKRKSLYIPGLNPKTWRKWAKGNDHQSTKDKGGYDSTELVPNKEIMNRNEAQEEYNLSKLPNAIMRTKSKKDGASIYEEPSSPTVIRRRRRKPSAHNEKIAELEIKDLEMPDEKDLIMSSKMPITLRIRYSIWWHLQYLKRYEFKFALKMALAVLILCIPAFIPSSEGWYYAVRGQWAPLTVISIMNPTSGGTLEASFWRIVGTLIGAFAGWAALAAGKGSAYLLGTFAVLLAIPFFYITIASTYNKVGSVTLTTYMVVALSGYTASADGDTIEGTVWKRTITLIVGICVALLLNSLIWPFIARRMVRKSIANCLNQLEDYYTFLMGTFLYHDPNELPSEKDIIKGEKLESKIQKSIEACSVLLELTEHEPRLRGPFPKIFYSEMITSMRNMLDRMLSIRIALIQMPGAVKHDVCAKTFQTDKRDLMASMLLCFHTVAGSLRSKSVLPVYMPNIRGARLKLLYHRRKNSKNTNWVKYRNLTWFAMASSTEELIVELDYLAELVRSIVGDNEFSEFAKNIEGLANFGATNFNEDPSTKEELSLYTCS